MPTLGVGFYLNSLPFQDTGYAMHQGSVSACYVCILPYAFYTVVLLSGPPTLCDVSDLPVLVDVGIVLASVSYIIVSG